MIEYIPPFISLSISFVVLLFLLQSNWANMVLDHPNQRSLHTRATPRTGGLGLLAGVLSGWILVAPHWSWIGIIIFLLAISFLDDVRGLSVRWRLLAQLFACAVFVIIYVQISEWWSLALVVVAMVWIVNLYNFMDGADGLAGGMALFGFGFYGLAAYLAGDIHFAAMSACIAASASAFLIFNIHPARIFMGDAGSVPLGFLVGSMGLYGWQHGLWPIWLPVLVFSPFIVDATVTLIKRLLHGERVWQAHRSHYYQRMVQMGFGHRNTAIVEYILMLLVGGSAIFLLKQTMTIVLFVSGFWLLVYLILARLIDKRWLDKQPSSNTFG